MFAHGERLLLPILAGIFCFVVVVCPATLWVLANSRDRSHRRSVISWAVLLVLGCGGGAVLTLKSFTWPPDLGDWVGVLIWIVPAGSGVIALKNVAASARHERDPNN